jgi:hypothetical protein
MVGRETREAVRNRFVPAQIWVHYQGSARVTCGVNKVAVGQNFSPSPSIFPISIIPPLHHIHSRIIWGLDTVSVSGHSPT